MARRAGPLLLLAAVAVLLGWYVVYSRRVVDELRREAALESVMYARVFRAISDTSGDAAASALIDVRQHIVDKGVPVVILDTAGNPTDLRANVPAAVSDDRDRLREFAYALDRDNPPVPVDGIGTVHYGNTMLVRGLRVIPLVQTGLIILLGVAAFVALWARGRADRERTWAGMAREAAHQLGTPLTSLSGWAELLGERTGDPLIADALVHMRGDLARLDRVAHRFERIGTPPRREPVDLNDLVARVSDYFRVRAPKLARAVTVRTHLPIASIIVRGDPVLLEWALEAVLKNALDALAGRGGAVDVELSRLDDGRARVRVADDGPGIPRELRASIFDAGVTTKPHGWGIGLSLARRIVEENHDGRLTLASTDHGAIFDISLP